MAVNVEETKPGREELKTGRGESSGFDHVSLPPLEEQRRVVADTGRRFNGWLGGSNGQRAS